MGEILQSLIEERNRLLQRKTQLSNAAVTIAVINAKLVKLNNIITKIESGGWDA